MHCGMCSIPGLIVTVSQDNQHLSPDIAKLSLGTKSSLAEKHWVSKGKKAFADTLFLYYLQILENFVLTDKSTQIFYLQFLLKFICNTKINIGTSAVLNACTQRQKCESPDTPVTS